MGTDSYIAASGATAQLRDLDVVANNLANSSTPGYRRGESIFRAVLESSIRDQDGRRLPGAPTTSFVSTAGVGADFGRGSVESTGSPLHSMIDGPGFFEVSTPNGLRYSRAGNFIINRDGNLSTPSGHPVEGEGGPITIGGRAARIESSGAVIDSAGTILGRLKIVDFARPQNLIREGETVFAATEAAEQKEVEESVFITGAVEGSNVEASRELALMVTIQRAYETNMRAMKIDDETTQSLIEGMR